MARPTGAGGSTSPSREERRVVFASPLATVFEWYDFGALFVGERRPVEIREF